jgi:2-succinyl-5-enolpyruvyl-6-hydroxy-3-cyclohexene-1-carboxylate synthase
MASEAPTTVLLGDVAFVHDESSLTALAARQLTLTIVVTDNDGGAIFSFLPQAAAMSTERFEQLFGTPHGTDVVAVARAHGLRAFEADDADALSAGIRDGGTSVIRVRTDRRRNVDVHAALNAIAVAAIS